MVPDPDKFNNRRLPLLLLGLLALTLPIPQAVALDLLSEKSVFEMSFEELLSLEVSIATTDKQPIHEAPNIITLINREDIAQQNPLNVSDMLPLVPGLNMVI